MSERIIEADKRFRSDKMALSVRPTGSFRTLLPGPLRLAHDQRRCTMRKIGVELLRCHDMDTKLQILLEALYKLLKIWIR